MKTTISHRDTEEDKERRRQGEEETRRIFFSPFFPLVSLAPSVALWP
jgi:hypothetical protein